MRRSSLLFALLLLAPLSATAQAGETRKAQITWRLVPGAVKYDFELSANAEMDPLTLRKDFGEINISLPLKPGTYFFRVRGIDKTDEPGPWSEVQGFVVNSVIPPPISPVPNAKFNDKLPESGIDFKWKPVMAGSKYLFQVSDSKGIVIKRNVDDTSVSWSPPHAGVFKWRVGYETQTGEEWGKFRSFTVSKIAANGEAPKPVIIVEKSPDKDSEPDERDSLARPAEWSLLVRAAESVVAYSALDRDTGVNAAGAALVALYNGEIRWRGSKRADQLWTLSAALNFEVINQVVLGNTFTMPRGYARVFYGKEAGKWRFSPFIQAGAGQSGIFIVETTNTAKQGKVFRDNAGLGGAATYRASKTLLFSALGVLRYDTGGTSDALPNALSPSLAYELGFGVGLSLSPHWSVEGRLRVLQESFNWAPASGTANGNSSLSDVYIIMDAGIGFKF